MVFSILTGFAWMSAMKAQELEPRSLANVPIGTRFGLVNYAFSSGNILYDPALDLDDLNARVNSISGVYVHAFDFFGMAAKYHFILPYVNGYWQGIYQGDHRETSRSGLADVRLGFSFNFHGAPAFKKEEFAAY